MSTNIFSSRTGSFFLVMMIGHCCMITQRSHAALVERNHHHHHHHHERNMNRRDALITAGSACVRVGTAVSLAPLVLLPTRSAAAASAAEDTTTAIDMMAASVNAAAVRTNTPKLAVSSEMVDMEKINLARRRRRSSVSSSNVSSSYKKNSVIVSLSDPPPLLSLLRAGIDGKSSIKIPRIGYSLYKTPVDQAARCTALALRAGVRHLDVATDYGSNTEIGNALRTYLNAGMVGLDQDILRDEKPELLERFDAMAKNEEMHTAKTTLSSSSSSTAFSPAPQGLAGRRGRREGVFIHHKISNTEQRSNDPVFVRRAVKSAIAALGCSYLDLVSIHSPLTDKARRLESYKVLLDLRDSGFIKSVGVCNCGIGALQEILDDNDNNLDLPAVNQLELSPFNQHRDIVDWCDQHGVAVSCSAWSKLSSADGPTEQWDILAKLAQQKQMTKAQVLVRWSLQKGYICVPRSSSASKVERLAIAENSYGGVNNNNSGGGGPSSFILTPEELSIIDGLDISFPAGKLGRRDGWIDSDVTGANWDPTNFV